MSNKNCSHEEREWLIRNWPLAPGRLIWKKMIEPCKLILKEIRERQTWNILPKNKEIPKTLKIEYYIFKEKLLSHIQYLFDSNIPNLEDPNLLVKGILTRGPQFAAEKKEQFEYSIKESIAVSNVRTPEEVKTLDLESIDQLFPSRHYIPFEFPRDISDVEYSFLDPPRITSYKLEELKEVMRLNIKKNIILRNYDVIDSIKNSNSSQGLDFKKGKPIKKKSYKSRESKNYTTYIEDNELNYMISFTTKSADDYRVIALADTYTKNLNYIVRESTSKINNCKWDSYGKPRWELVKFLNWGRDRHFIMVDQKKSGWTFPMELMHAYFEVVSDMYPNYKPFQIYKEIFKDKKINFLIDNVWRNPKRGFVLGMWDNIMSFILSCMFEIFLENFIRDDPDLGAFKVSGKFWGDDQIIRADTDSLEYTYQIMNRWMNYMSRMGCIINEKKCFVSQYGVLCEVYSSNGPINLDKGSVWMLSSLNSLRGCNTFHRKSLWCGFHDTIKSALSWFRKETRDSLILNSERNLNKCQILIGYEFDKEEVLLPYQLGGWEIFRDEDGNPNLLEYLLEHDRSNKWCNIAMIPNYNAFANNNFQVRKAFFSAPWYKDMRNIIGNVNYINPVNFLDNLLKSIPKTDGTPYEKYETWHEIYLQRKKAYKSRKFSNSRTVLEKLTREGEFKSAYLNPKILFKKEFSDYPWKKQKSTKSKIDIDPFRACALFLKKAINENPFEISFDQEDRISIVDITSNIFKDISSSPCTIPSDWYVFGQISGIDIISASIKFEEEFFESLFNYSPPLDLNLEEDLGIGEISLDRSIYWDKDFGIPFSLDNNELFLINCCDWTKDDLLSFKINMTFEEYRIECLCRSAFKEEDDDLEFQEDNKLLENLQGTIEKIDPSILINKKVEISELINTQFTTNVQSLLDMEDDYSSEEEEETSEPDETMLILRSLGIDSFDLLGIGGTDEYFDNDDYE
jgi:hypothetical protein